MNSPGAILTKSIPMELRSGEAAGFCETETVADSANTPIRNRVMDHPPGFEIQCRTATGLAL
jgi:hypothetical protein